MVSAEIAVIFTHSQLPIFTRVHRPDLTLLKSRFYAPAKYKGK